MEYFKNHMYYDYELFQTARDLNMSYFFSLWQVMEYIKNHLF